MKNKKGFTLVELLAVIVILALIMGIAVVSIGGVLQTSREKTFRETAASLINGVRQQLYIENKIAAGSYGFEENILEKGGKESPFSGTFQYECPTGDNGTQIGSSNVCKYATEPTGCTASSKAYVKVTNTDGVFSYKICLSDGTKYVFADESALLDNTATIN